MRKKELVLPFTFFS